MSRRLAGCRPAAVCLLSRPMPTCRWATNSVGHAHYLKQTIAFALLVAVVVFLEYGNSSPIRCVCVGDESWQDLGKQDVTATNFVASHFWPTCLFSPKTASRLAPLERFGRKAPKKRPEPTRRAGLGSGLRGSVAPALPKVGGGRTEACAEPLRSLLRCAGAGLPESWGYALPERRCDNVPRSLPGSRLEAT